MSRLISDVLGASEPHFTHTIMEWERRSGHPSHDVRLITDIYHRRRQAIDKLGLDYDDTTARELYFSLRAKALQDSGKFSELLQVNLADDPEKMIAAVVKYVETLPYPKELWAVKQSFIKATLRANPPKKLMKLLGLRSIDSVIKRANVSEFLALAYAIENNVWLGKLHNSYKKLRAGDLQPAESSFIVISSKNQKKLSQLQPNPLALVRPNYETGSILINPPMQRFQGDVLSITLALVEAMSQLRIYSAYFRHISVRNDFGLKFSESLGFGLPSLPSSAHTISWRDLQHYLSHDPELFDTIKQPHFQDGDVKAPSAVEALANVSPHLQFWVTLEGVFHSDGKLIVSCHLMDVLSGAINDLEPRHVPLSFMRAQLWQDLGAKYLSEKHLQPELLRNII